MRTFLEWLKRLRRSAAGTLMLGGILLVLNIAVSGLSWSHLRQGRAHLADQARVSAETTALTVERVLAGEIRAIDQALLSVRREFRREQEAGGIRSTPLNAYIRDIFGQYPELVGIRIADEAGVVNQGIDVDPDSHINIQDRDYFITLATSKYSELVFSRPVIGRLSHRWVLILARRLEHLDGRFAGVIYGVIDIDHLTLTLAQIDCGPHGIVVFRDANLRLLARYPFTKGLSDQIGDTKTAPEFPALVRSGKTSATYVAPAGLDHTLRTFSFRKVESHPLFVGVGLAAQDYLADWQAQVRKTLASLAIFCLSSILLGLVLYRDWRRSQAQIRELRQALDEVKTLRDFLPICMYCRKVRDDDNYWSNIESYITRFTGSLFSHGICPECRPKMEQELNEMGIVREKSDKTELRKARSKLPGP